MPRRLCSALTITLSNASFVMTFPHQKARALVSPWPLTLLNVPHSAKHLVALTHLIQPGCLQQDGSPWAASYPHNVSTSTLSPQPQFLHTFFPGNKLQYTRIQTAKCRISKLITDPQMLKGFNLLMTLTIFCKKRSQHINTVTLQDVSSACQSFNGT